MSDEKKVNAETTEVQPPEGAPAPKKRVWPIVMSAFAVIVIAVIYALASTGRLSAIWNRIRRTGSEMTAGAVGKKPDRDGKER